MENPFKKNKTQELNPPQLEPQVYSKQCLYVRFHQPVPPALNKEPVSEFKLKPDGNSIQAMRYVVDSITYTEHGVIYTAYGETNIVPLANVTYARLIPQGCLLYTSDAADDLLCVDLG